MEKKMYLGVVLAVSLLLCACTNTGNPTKPADTQPPTRASTEACILPTTIAETTVEVVPETTLPPHSELYLPEYTTQQVLEYFEEIVLRMEYTDGDGDCTLVQKWNTTIRYRFYGEPTEVDKETLYTLFAQLNEIPGFPGIYEAANNEMENLTIRFMDPEAFNVQYSEVVNGEDAYGATQFWYYTDTNEIYSANIGYRMDVDQTTRLSVLLEEVVNVLGTSDTVLRTDSVVYQHSNENTALSDMDWLILKLLYNPAIQCAMDYDSCRAVIQQLYY